MLSQNRKNDDWQEQYSKYGFFINFRNILWIMRVRFSDATEIPMQLLQILIKLARESIKFTNAFASAPVCSPSRSCLIQGALPQVWVPSICVRGFPCPLPSLDSRLFYGKNGYYTTNNVKTDYNSGNYQQIIEKSWNESSSTAHWRKREKKEMPFFTVFNLMTSHQSRSMVWPYEKFQNEIQSKLGKDQVHNPKKIKLPPTTPIPLSSVKPWHDSMTA